MSEEEKAAQQPDRAPLSAGKRNALLRYMAILFGVAFLLVLLSFLIQMRDSRETISDLHESKASALENALQLQEENQALTVANGELAEKISDLEAQAQTAADEAEAAKADLELQLAQAETRREEAEAESQKTLADTQAAYDLLLAATVQMSLNLRDEMKNSLEELAPQRSLLTKEGQRWYDQMVSSLTAEEAPETEIP